MGGVYRRKRTSVKDKTIKKKYRTRRREKDLDQVHAYLQSKEPLSLLHDPDLPGGGRHYCLHCARYFVNDKTLQVHFKNKLHKRRVKALKEPVYSQHEADQAAGMGSYVVPAPPILESSDKPRAMEMEQTMRQGVSELAI